MIFLEIHSNKSSSLSQTVHAALANVIQDPLVLASGNENNLTSMGSGDSSSNVSNRCQNCSKLQQQLTLLIYEVLNLENTMESKICEYVQRRLAEIVVAPEEKISNKNVELSANKKFRAERTLTFENVLIGDSTLKYLDPARFDADRKTYIKTMVERRRRNIFGRFFFSFVEKFSSVFFSAENESLKFSNSFKRRVLSERRKCSARLFAKKIEEKNKMKSVFLFRMFHIGANDLNRDKLTEQEVSEQIKELIVTTKTVSPQSDLYISLIFARQANDESRLKTEKLNALLQGKTSRFFFPD